MLQAARWTFRRRSRTATMPSACAPRTRSASPRSSPRSMLPGVATTRSCTPSSQAADAASLARALRELREHAFLRTMLRDLTGRADLSEVCAATTRLADVAVASAVEAHTRWLVAAHGEPHRRGKRRRSTPAGDRHGQARRRRAQRVLRRRSRLRLSRGRRHATATGRSPTRNSSTASAAASSPRSTSARRTATCSASTCGCVRTAIRDR